MTEISTNAWGDRGGRIRDPFGNTWWIVTHVEDVDEQEMARRMGEPSYIEGMRTARETFDRDRAAERHVFETTATIPSPRREAPCRYE